MNIMPFNLTTPPNNAAEFAKATDVIASITSSVA